MVEALAEHLGRYTARSPEAFVFLSSQGTHLRRSNFNRHVWQPAIQAAGVEGLRVHDLRHTAGTLATAAGGSLREVMDRLGHSTTVAAVRYQHVMADRDAAIAPRAEPADRGRLSRGLASGNARLGSWAPFRVARPLALEVGTSASSLEPSAAG